MPPPPTVSLAELNEMSRNDFVAVLGDVFEHAPWVAETAYACRPFAIVTALHEAMLAAITALPAEQVTAFLDNHPDLAGPAARREPLTADSAREQAGAGLDSLSGDETARLAQWNTQYRSLFGFPFIICALRHTKDSIFAECTRRLAGDPSEERRTALSEIARISALRLAHKVDGPGMPAVHGRLSTHLLDTARGRPASGIPIELYRVPADGLAVLVAEAVSNEDGRTDAPLICGRPIPIGTYQLRFSLGAYLSGAGFLDVVPIRFKVAEPEAHYHVPLLFTPWSYSTYRGS
jgi:2-oxo-4-hydroxy-4-carboxy-5-ureidoimidazoline decarboxylase